MKKFLIPLSLLLAAPAFAAAPSPELAQVTRALVNSPTIVAELQKNRSDHLTDVEISEVSQGINQYKLVFDRECECVPSTATVDITEDLTPTYRDGAAIYHSSVKIEHGR